MGELDNRREQTERRIIELRAELKDAERLAAGNACVYATGSFGRGEASDFSDLDLFIASRSPKAKIKLRRRRALLSRLDEICIKADLIEATRKLHIPEFSGDGQYLTNYSAFQLIKTLGTPQDDIENTFTARLLLLLESRPLIGDDAYDEIVEEVLAAYWGDFADHKHEFMPAFLANDILRLWRTFCVNYEARTSSAPDREKAKRKLKNYKLKHSRLLTCFSAILYLMAKFALANTVSPLDALAMVKLTPTKRLEWINLEKPFIDTRDSIKKLFDQYEIFLSVTKQSEVELIDKFMDRDSAREYMIAASRFGDTVFEALKTIGDVGHAQRLYRLVVV